MTDRLWTVEEVAEYLHVSRATVYKLPLRIVKIGKSRRYHPDDVKLYVHLHTNAA